MSLFTKEAFSFTETKKKFEDLLQRSILSFGSKTKLRDACEYALLNGGKRIRPLIVYMIAEALHQNKEVSAAALSIEFFHTASLIVDDLPCMDNDDLRREKPALHKVFGEDVAILASYALMTAGFEKIYESSMRLSKDAEKACLTTLYEVSRASGIHGATGGQFLDLYPQETSFKHLLQIIEKKTVRLFEIAFLYGWIFGGGDLCVVEEVKKLGYHFGMAFQIADDLQDEQEDKTKNKKGNLALHRGKERAREDLVQELQHFEKLSLRLGIKTQAMDKLQNKIRELSRK